MAKVGAWIVMFSGRTGWGYIGRDGVLLLVNERSVQRWNVMSTQVFRIAYVVQCACKTHIVIDFTTYLQVCSFDLRDVSKIIVMGGIFNW